MSEPMSEFKVPQCHQAGTYRRLKAVAQPLLAIGMTAGARSRTLANDSNCLGLALRLQLLQGFRAE